MALLPMRRRDLMTELGLSPEQVARAVRRGDWCRLQRGWYQPSAGTSPLLVGLPASAPRVGQAAPVPRVGPARPAAHLPAAHLSAVAVASLLSTSRRAAVAEAHAALAWGLPRPLGGAGLVVLTTEEGRPQAWGSVRMTVARLPPEHVVPDATGLPVTSPARTVLDCARRLPGRDALAIADAALRRGIVDADALESMAAAMVGWPGIRAARHVIGLADGARESPLESWSAWSFDDLGVAMPRWQVSVVDPESGLVYRLDCRWGEQLVGEADGRAKALLVAEQRGGASDVRLARVLDDERRREARLRAMGFDIVRWGARDVLDDVRARRLAALLTGKLRQPALAS